MTSVFPYGNELAKPDDWIGKSHAKSIRWLVSYVGSFAFACGYHSFIFWGLESMCIGVVKIINCGLVSCLPIGKMFEAVGGRVRNALVLEKINDRIGNATKSRDVAKMKAEKG